MRRTVEHYFAETILKQITRIRIGKIWFCVISAPLRLHTADLSCLFIISLIYFRFRIQIHGPMNKRWFCCFVFPRLDTKYQYA